MTPEQKTEIVAELNRLKRKLDIKTLGNFLFQTVNDTQWPDVHPGSAVEAASAFQRLFKDEK